ncbi:MAG TPA: hypothetical protein VK666_24650 [Chryseolinea sp.]|nr:hypothetical protein [Chryseolinea sp.]
MSKKISLALCLLMTCHLLRGQSDTLSRNFVGVSYFSEGGFYPGFTLNAERSILANKNFEILAAARLGAYFHYRDHTGVFFMIQSGQRVRIYKHLYFEHYLGLGYLQSFLSGGDAYYVDATGKIHKTSPAGNPHLMPSVSFGLSYATTISQRPVRFFGRPIIFWLIPFNQTALVQYGLEIGTLVNLRK